MASPVLERLRLTNFTAFPHLDLELSPGVNVLVGGNATGKTHILKVMYAALHADGGGLPNTLLLTFNQSDLQWIHSRPPQGKRTSIYASYGFSQPAFREVSFENGNAVETIEENLHPQDDAAIFIPCKEMLIHSSGFRSLYKKHSIPFDYTYFDIIDEAFFPPLKEPIPEPARQIMDKLQGKIGGRVVAGGNEVFYLEDSHGRLEFSLVAEGIRKLALLWLLVANGRLAPGAVLLWDEPETNLNPVLMKTVVEVLFDLARWGVQVVLATHSYFILKELDLQGIPTDDVRYHCLERAGNGDVSAHTVRNYLDISPNFIADVFADLYAREMIRSVQQSKDMP